MFRTGRGEPCPQGEPEGFRAVVCKLGFLRDSRGRPCPVSRSEGVAGQAALRYFSKRNDTVKQSLRSQCLHSVEEGS